MIYCHIRPRIKHSNVQYQHIAIELWSSFHAHCLVVATAPTLKHIQRMWVMRVIAIGRGFVVARLNGEIRENFSILVTQRFRHRYLVQTKSSNR